MEQKTLTGEEEMLVNLVLASLRLTGESFVDEGRCEWCGLTVISCSFQFQHEPHFYDLCLSDATILKIKGAIYEEGKRTDAQRKQIEGDSGNDSKGPIQN